MRVIDEIWIINANGITLFNLSKDDRIDPQLFGGFISAIESFIKSLGYKEINAMSLGESKIMFYHGDQSLMFISRSGKKVKEKLIIKGLKLVEQKFLEHHQETLKNWNSDPDIFARFGEIIKEIFEDNPEKLVEKSLWWNTFNLGKKKIKKEI